MYELLSLIFRMNEFSKTCTSGTESHENARVRAYLFDITFLMLCYIIQTHGIEVSACIQVIVLYVKRSHDQ